MSKAKWLREKAKWLRDRESECRDLNEEWSDSWFIGGESAYGHAAKAFENEAAEIEAKEGSQ